MPSEQIEARENLVVQPLDCLVYLSTLDSTRREPRISRENVKALSLMDQKFVHKLLDLTAYVGQTKINSLEIS